MQDVDFDAAMRVFVVGVVADGEDRRVDGPLSGQRGGRVGEVEDGVVGGGRGGGGGGSGNKFLL